MEIDECSVNGDSGAEEDEDDDLSQASDSESSSASSDSSTSTDSGEESADENGISTSESESSDDGEAEEAEAVEHPEERWETCVAGGSKVKLPQDLCEHFAIFKEMFEEPNFLDNFTQEQKQSFVKFLPNFPKECNVQAELETTMKMLLHRENERFDVAPLEDFHNHLSAGHFRPDIKRMRSLVRKAQHRRFLFEEKKRTYDLAGQLLKSRESLLSNAYKQGFSQSSHRPISKPHWRKPKPALVEEKTQVRYIEELQALRSELGTSARLEGDTTSENEENYSQHLLNSVKQKKKRKSTMPAPSAQGLHTILEDNAIRPVFSTLQRSSNSVVQNFQEQTDESYRAMLISHKKRRSRRDAHPELNTQGIALAELMQRAQIGQKHKLSIGGPSRLPNAKKRIKMEQPSLGSITPVKMNLPPTIKQESNNSEFILNDEVKHSNLLDTEQKPYLPPVKAEPIDSYDLYQPVKVAMSPVPPRGGKSIPMPIDEIKEEIIEDMVYEQEPQMENNIITEEPRMESEEEEVPCSKKEIDLDSIDMMQLPIQLDDGIDLLSDVKTEDEVVISLPENEISTSIVDDISMTGGGELMQETHMCFFSLLRDAFLSKGEYRMNRTEMKDAILQWQENPISPLNDWYSLAPSWPALVPIALGFLAGELIYTQDQHYDSDQEFVPYLENKGRGVYAWIGAGRDSDSRLFDLCSKFLFHKDSLVPPKASTPITVVSVKQQQSIPLSNLNISNSNDNNMAILGGNKRVESPAGETFSIDGGVSSLPEWEPPHALCPTDWKVRVSLPEEREEFRRQERMRYAAPHKAFTYRMHGYTSVVGPVKGIYQHNVGSGLTKARGHSLLVSDRPNFVTILALVRDATARLPNGKGTRADICILLRDSQYIQDDIFSNDREGNLNSVVSGALDRLHYEADPCVRYYPKRKEWLYLHRARSESEFEMYHQQLQGVPKNKKNTSGSARSKVLQSANKPASSAAKEQAQAQTILKEPTPKKEKKTAAQSAATIARKEQKKTEDKISAVVESITMAEPPPISITVSSSPSISFSPASVSTSTVAAQTMPTPAPPPPPPQPVALPPTSVTMLERETPISIVETKPQQQPVTSTAMPVKKVTNVSMKPVTVVKSNAPQSLLQSNQHFPHHQIQVSTSAGLQTIRLSGHSVLQSAQTAASSSASATTSNASTNVATIFPTAKIQQTQPTIVSTAQPGKSILQSANVKQPQQQQHVLPGKTLLASQIKLVSSGQIKSLLTGHGLQGQTIFIKQSPTSAGVQTQQLQTPQTPLQQRVAVATPQQAMQAPGMQRIIAQIGGKPIAVQIQQSPQQQQQQQQKVLAKVLTSAGTGQLISVESLLAQKGLKLATTTAHAGQLNRQGKQVIQTQYQVVSQAQGSGGQQKIIVSTQQQQQQPQTVRMVTAQLAGKPIVLASSGGKSVGVNVATGTGGSVVLGKHTSQTQSAQQQQPIILPSQLLNIKTLHGLKVIPTPAGLKTTGAAVYARVIAPTTMSVTQPTQQQVTQPSTQQQQQSTVQSITTKNATFGGTQ